MNGSICRCQSTVVFYGDGDSSDVEWEKSFSLAINYHAILWNHKSHIVKLSWNLGTPRSFSEFSQSWRESEVSVCVGLKLQLSSLKSIFCLASRVIFKMVCGCISTLKFSSVPPGLKAYTCWLYELESSVGHFSKHFQSSFLPIIGRRKMASCGPSTPTLPSSLPAVTPFHLP